MTEPIPVATLYAHSTHSSPFQVQRSLNDLLRMGSIERPARGFYTLAPVTPAFPLNTTTAINTDTLLASSLDTTDAITLIPQPANGFNATDATTLNTEPVSSFNITAATVLEPTPTITSDPRPPVPTIAAGQSHEHLTDTHEYVGIS